MHNLLTKRNIFSWTLALLLSSFVVSPAFAATIRFSSGQGYGIGDTVPVQVLVGTESGNPLNAVSASVSFPTDKLQLQSISKAGSIVSYWVEEPTSSNALGTASFEGLVLNPGWSGASGQVVTLSFKAKATGSATISFSKASILANDGMGTNILSSATPLTISLATGAAAIESEPLPLVSTALLPLVRSSTHPEQARWYNNNSPVFSWNLPQGVLATRLLYDKKSTAVPTVEYAPAISTKSIEDVEDGSYYFHIQFKDGNGWGPVAHYGFNIDTAAPADFNVTFTHADSSKNSRPALYFSTTDTGSGIESYLVNIDDDKGTTVASGQESNGYTPASLKLGENKVVVTAYDKAGNSTKREELIMVNESDVASLKTEEAVVAAKSKEPSPLGKFLEDYLIMGFFAILITALLMAVIIFLFHHLRYFSNHVETGLHAKFHKLERGVRHDFEVLNEEVENYFDRLTKAGRRRDLSREEKSFLKNFRKYISAVEKDIVEKIESVEPEIKE